MDLITDNEARRERLRSFRILAVALPVTVLALGGYYAYPFLLARYHFHAAQSAAERNDLAGEQQHLLECLKGWKTDPEIYLRTARAARRLGNFEEADRCLNQCTRFHGDPSEVELERSFLSLDRRNSNLEPRIVLETLRRAPENHADLPEALEKLSKSCLKEYRLQDALAALTLWIERQPNGVQPLLLRGWVLEQLAPNPQPALPDYRRAVELEPDNDVVRLRLAEALVKTKQSAQALPELEMLQRRQPGSPVVLLNLSLCRADLGDSQEAAQLLDALLAPQRLAQVQELSECLRSDRPLPHEIEAADWYRQGMTQAPYGSRNQAHYVVDLYIQALVERAKLAARNKGDGEPFLRQAVKLDPFDYAANYQLALCLEQRGEQAEARRLQTKLAEIRADQERMSEAAARVLGNPHDPAPRCIAAEILLRNGQPQEAMRWLRGALQENPNYPQAVRLLTLYQRLRLQPNRAATVEEQKQTAP